MMKALILGLGGIGQRHARNLRALCGDAIELCAYRVRGRPHVLTSQLAEDHTKRVAEEFGIRLFRDLQSALDARPQIAFITNPTSLHIESALACAKAGCDLFIEKPLSHSLEMVQTLIEQVEHRQLIAMVGYQLRFHPCLERFSQIVESGALGRLLMVRATVG